jgi:hypothetical protein
MRRPSKAQVAAGWLSFLLVYAGGVYCFYRALDAMTREAWTEGIFWMLVILTTAVGRIGMVVDK